MEMNVRRQQERSPAFPLSFQKLVEFLLIAKKNSYAGNGTEKKQPCRPLAHDFIYEDEDFLYLDTYLGGTAFSGEEAVWEKQQDKRVPIWSMNYAGRILADGFNSRFLKEALSHVQKEAPFRGAGALPERGNMFTTVHSRETCSGFREGKKSITETKRSMNVNSMAGALA